MKKEWDKLPEETPQQYFMRMLKEQQVSFSSLAVVYTKYLEEKEKEHRLDISEANLLLVGVKETTLWAGSKESYRKRVKAFLDKFKLF